MLTRRRKALQTPTLLTQEQQDALAQQEAALAALQATVAAGNTDTTRMTIDASQTTPANTDNTDAEAAGEVRRMSGCADEIAESAQIQALKNLEKNVFKKSRFRF